MAQQSSFGQFMKANSTPRSQRYAISAERANAIRNAPAAQPTETSSVPPDSPFYNPAKVILTPAQTDQDTKADAYDHFYAAKTPQDLATRLQGLNLPADVQKQLLDAKTLTMPVRTNLDNAIEAVHKLASMDPQLMGVGGESPRSSQSLSGRKP